MTVLEDTIRKIEEWKKRGYTSLYDHEMRKVVDDALEILREYKRSYLRICSWKFVTDGTPKSGFDILMYADGEVYKGYFDTEIERFKLDDGYILSGVTRWTPVPYPPKMDKEEGNGGI